MTRRKLGKHGRKLGSKMGECGNDRGANRGARRGRERDFHNTVALDGWTQNVRGKESGEISRDEAMCFAQIETPIITCGHFLLTLSGRVTTLFRYS